MTVELMMDKIEKAVRNSPLQIPNLNDFHDTYWKSVIPHVNINGLWMEFGVFRGRSIQKISSLINNTVYGFDSFDGLHEYWDTNNPKGVYNSGGKIPEGAIVGDNHSMFDSSPTKNIEPWNKNVKLIQGYFENTLPQFLKENKENVAFVNIDSDLYSSCVTVLNNLKPRIVEGTIICFDELLDYPSYKEHEIKAFAEFLIDTGWNIEPLIYNSVGVSYTQASIKIIK
jgi:hypothetical protein